MYGELKIFSGRAHPSLTGEICDYLDLPVGEVELFDFSDGETFCQDSRERAGVGTSSWCNPSASR